MALDANGRRLLVTSGSVRAPIYQVNLHFCSLSYVVRTHARRFFSGLNLPTPDPHFDVFRLEVI